MAKAWWPVLRGLEVILQILRLGGHFCGDHGASAPPFSCEAGSIGYCQDCRGQGLHFYMLLQYNLICHPLWITIAKFNTLNLADWNIIYTNTYKYFVPIVIYQVFSSHVTYFYVFFRYFLYFKNCIFLFCKPKNTYIFVNFIASKFF